MTLNDLPPEIICIITDDLDDPSVINLSLTCVFLKNTLKHIISTRKKIKLICDTMSNNEIEKFLKDKNTPKNNTEVSLKDSKVYFFNLQNRKEKGISFDKGYYENGQLRYEQWYLNGEEHRPTAEGPASIGYYANGQVDYEAWYLNGQQHRPTSKGPAIIGYYENGHRRYEGWYLNDKHHRPTTEGPASIGYYENGYRKHEEWKLNGDRHRPTSEGPSWIKYYKNGEIKEQ